MINTFKWNHTFNNIDITSVMLVENCIDQKKCREISDNILEFKLYTESQPKDVFCTDSNPGCWRGYPHLADIDTPGLTEDQKKYIYELIIKLSEEYLERLPRPEDLCKSTNYVEKLDSKFFLIQAWANVNDTRASNVIHTHTGNLVSGCLYFQSTDTGAIEFVTHNTLYNQHHPLSIYHGTYRHYPKDGDALIFPSYLAHSVESNPSNKQRINIAFNVQYPPRIT